MNYSSLVSCVFLFFYLYAYFLRNIFLNVNILESSTTKLIIIGSCV